jgi:HEAT repeat protein
MSLWGMSIVCGCTDGPFYEMKKLNPVIREQWRKDEARGIPLFHDRLADYENLRRSIARYSEEEKDKYIQVLTSTIPNESSPEIRRSIALTLAEVVDREAALEGLVNLSKDKNPKVRLEVAKALRKSGTDTSKTTLMALASSDKVESVRYMATESLGTHRSDDVKQFLAKQLEDRSPGVQRHACLALKEFTGIDFQGDVSKWKMYLAGEEVEPEQPSFFANPLQSIWR